MSAKPVLMVQYTNDATEVRYANGSCLQMTGCGSTYVHHESPGETIHPAHGMRMIHGRSQFTTSNYRQKVTEALDFRNRFSEQPYLCPDLIFKDQLVPLYADINNVSWPQSMEQANYEYQKDGSVRLVSDDEYCSMIFSPHRQDFTVCYLSKVSQEKVKKKSKFKARSMRTSNMESELRIPDTITDEKHRRKYATKNTPDMHMDINPAFRNESENISQTRHRGHLAQKETGFVTSTPLDNAELNCQNVQDLDADKLSKDNSLRIDLQNASSLDNEIYKNLTPRNRNTHQLDDDINFSPISIASNRMSPKSSPRDEDESFRRYSTPTNRSPQQDIKSLQQEKVNFASLVNKKTNDGSFLEYLVDENETLRNKDDQHSTSKPGIPIQNTRANMNTHTLDKHAAHVNTHTLDKHAAHVNTHTLDKHATHVNTHTLDKHATHVNTHTLDKHATHVNTHTLDKHSTTSNHKSQIYYSQGCKSDPTQQLDLNVNNSSGINLKHNKELEHQRLNVSNGSGDSDIVDIEGDSETRLFYSWVTRHFSVEECTVGWRHPVSLAKSLLEKREDMLANTDSHSPKENPKYSKKGLSSKVVTPLPCPLFMTCPGQHMHVPPGKLLYDTDKDLEENISLFKLGKLKVILIEGVIFRLIRLSSTRMVEIYPGDGSVILSQGLTGHFYKHIIPKPQNQIEERAYSLKAPPPTGPKSPYSIERLIKRANRFLLQANQEDKVITAADVCCWKYVEKTLEILPTSLLEECNVPGHGKFSAFSNGYIRIVFEDRTALEMTCDFSTRVHGCMQHSHQHTDDGSVDHKNVLVTQPSLTTKQRGVCKLLLPNGHYQIVDVQKPGLYRKYTDTAIEWEAWVNSSPTQRRTFYQNRDQEESTTDVIEKELQRIKCFNYITDSTFLGKQGINQVPVSAGYHMYSKDHTGNQANVPDARTREQLGAVPGASRTIHPRHSELRSMTSSDHQGHQPHNLTPRDQHQGHQSYNLTPRGHSQGHHSVVPEYGNIANILPPAMLNSGMNNLEMLQGFNSVRQALLQTSKVINDIDYMLEKKD